MAGRITVPRGAFPTVRRCEQMAAQSIGITRRRVLGALVLRAAGVGGYFGYRRLTQRQPDFANVAYGAGERQVLDVYLPQGAGPFPFVLEIHGGAFKIGSKTMSAVSERLLAAGVRLCGPIIGCRALTCGLRRAMTVWRL